jgi:hypothetical protein
MRAHFLWLVVCVAPPELGVVLWICAHAQQVQAVQLVEDFEADTVACLAGLGVCDFHGVGGVVEFGEVGFGDHLVGNCWVVSMYEWLMEKGWAYGRQCPSMRSRRRL